MGMISGTPGYMSPEQAAGTAHRIDGRTDVYSLGVVLYEMLTGHVPFRATEFLELMRQVRDDEPQPPRQLIRDIPPELERACLKALAKQQQDRYTTAVDFTAYLNCYCRLGAEVQAAAEEEITIGTEQGFQLWHALGTLHKGAGMLLQSRREEGLALLLKGYVAFRATGAEVRVPAYLAMLGDAYTQSAVFEAAHATLNEGLAVVEKNDDRPHEAELHRLKGELLLADSDDPAGAEACFLQSIETAKRQQSKAWELRATMSLVRLWEQQGHRDEARSALAAVYSTFTEGFATPDLMDAAALLDSLA